MHDHIYLTRKYHAKSFYTFILAISFSRMGGDSYAEPASDSYLVGVTFPAPDRVGDSRESLFFHGAVAVTYVCIVGVLGYRGTDCNSIISVQTFTRQTSCRNAQVRVSKNCASYSAS